MLHDYHLYLASTLIRQRHPSIVMQQFIHIPWPEVRYWESTLSNTITLAIHNGLLGNDILGFQTQRDALPVADDDGLAVFHVRGEAERGSEIDSDDGWWHRGCASEQTWGGRDGYGRGECGR